MKPEKITNILHEELHPLPFQPRKTFRGIEELAADIQERGVLVPLLVRPREDDYGYDIVFGERRWRAANEAELDELPCIVRPMTDEEALELMIAELEQRDDVHPMEQALAYERMHKHHGKSIEDIAERVGKPKKHVLGRLKLCELCDEVRQACLEDKVSVPVALLIARIPDHGLQRKALERVGDGHWRGERMTDDDARDELDHRFLCDLDGASWDLADAALVPAAGPCTTCPHRTANQRELFGDPLGGKGIDGKGEYDVCTNPPCFKEKGDADWKRRTEDAKKKGLRVLNQKEAKEVVPKLRYTNSPFVELADTASYEVDPKHRKWKALLGKDAQEHVVLARDPESGQVHELVERAAATKLAKERHPELAAAAKKKNAGYGSGSVAVSENEKRARREVQARHQAGDAALGELVGVVEKSGAIEVAAIADFWRIIVATICDGSWNETLRQVCKRRQLEIPKKQDAKGVLQAELSTMTSEELAALVLEIVCTRGLYDTWSKDPDERLAQACKAFGVDYGKHKREAKKALEPKKEVDADKGKAKNAAKKGKAKGKKAEAGTAQA